MIEFRVRKQKVIKKRLIGEISLRNALDKQYLADLGEQQQYYADDDPGKKYVIDLPVHYNKWAAIHLSSNENRNSRIDWIEANLKDLVRCIEAPEIVERSVRSRFDGHYSLTNIVRVEDPGARNWEYMVVSISLSKGDSPFHQITTIHPIRHKELFKEDGLFRKKYTWTK